jgi:signal transduction histidine kinase
MELVTTLSNQVAVALENAAAFEEISRQQDLLMKLVAGIVHEVNTPLGVLRSSVNTIARSMDRTEAAIIGVGEPMGNQRAALEAIRTGRTLTENAASAGQRISTLVGSLKEYVNLEEEKRQVVDIRECVEQSVKKTRDNLKQGVVLECSLPKVEVLADCFPSRLSRAISNLLDNAEASIDRSGAIEVTLRLAERHAGIIIKDEGRGISPDELEGITEFGFTTKSGQMRTGLRMGLPYARRVVDEIGGHLSIESELGVGTTASLTIRLDC